MRIFHTFRHWLIEPSPKITEPDKRRQAALLSALLLGIIVVALLVESATVILINRAEYTGYRQTILAVCMLAIVYAISRTQHTRLAAVLALIIASIMIFLSGWAEPSGVLGGLFDFLILPL